MGQSAKWAIALIVIGFVGAALFYSPYIGLNAQIGLECVACSHVLSAEEPHIKFVRLTLIGGVLNSAMLLFFGGIIRGLIIGWKKLRACWN